MGNDVKGIYTVANGERKKKLIYGSVWIVIRVMRQKKREEKAVPKNCEVH